jgi:hypothetical protein
LKIPKQLFSVYHDDFIGNSKFYRVSWRWLGENFIKKDIYQKFKGIAKNLARVSKEI